MKDVHAHLRYLRIAPRKVRLVVDAVRGLSVQAAERDLQFNSKQAAVPVLKLLRSAMANAEHNFHLKPETLYIQKITADDGPTLRRYRPRALGSSAMIRKRTSHVTIVLAEREEIKESKKSKKHQESTKSEKPRKSKEQKETKSKKVTSDKLSGKAVMPAGKQGPGYAGQITKKQ